MLEVSNDSLEPVWDDGELVVSRATHTNGRRLILLVTPALAQPAPASLGRLERAYALRDELDSSWARPVELIRHRGQVAFGAAGPAALRRDARRRRHGAAARLGMPASTLDAEDSIAEDQQASVPRA